MRKFIRLPPGRGPVVCLACGEKLHRGDLGNGWHTGTPKTHDMRYSCLARTGVLDGKFRGAHIPGRASSLGSRYCLVVVPWTPGVHRSTAG